MGQCHEGGTPQMLSEGGGDVSLIGGTERDG